MAPAVTIVILNWNGRQHLETFLPSVVATSYENYSILLADNGSADDSLEFVRNTYPQIRILELERNYGFTKGNNLAIEQVDTPYYALLNSDVEVTPDWLQPLVKCMESDDSIASVQPKIRWYRKKTHFEYAGASGGYIDVLGYPFCRGRIFDELEEDLGQYEDQHEIFWATGACCLIRKSVTDQIGLFEDRFFAHMEEIDFCWRAKNFGYKILVEPKSVVFHLGGGTLKKTNPRKTFLNVRNSLSALQRNLPGLTAWFKIYLRLCLDGIWGMRALLRLDFKTIFAIIKAHFAFYLAVPYHWKQKRKLYKKLDKFPKLETGVYAGSAVWQHFVKGKRQFSDFT